MKKMFVMEVMLVAVMTTIMALGVAHAGGLKGRADLFDKPFNEAAEKVGVKHRLEFVSCSGTICNYKATGNVLVMAMAESKTDKTMTSVSVILASDSEHLSFAVAAMNTIATFSPGLHANERLDIFSSLIDEATGPRKKGHRTLGEMKYSIKDLEFGGIWFTAENAQD